MPGTSSSSDSSAAGCGDEKSRIPLRIGVTSVMVQDLFSAMLNVVKRVPNFAISAYPFGIPHTEEKANPTIVPVMTATIGLHQRIHPAPPADELIR